MGEKTSRPQSPISKLETMACSPYANTGVHLRHFKGIEEDVMAQHCKVAFNSGFPLDQVSLLAIAQALHDDKNATIDVGWIEGFLKRHPDVKRLKASAIDWQRANAANEENIKVYLANFRAFLARAKAAGAFEGDFWTPDQIFNYDEVSTDPMKGRNSKAAQVFGGLLECFGATLVHGKKKKVEMARAFATEASDKGLPFHVTCGITTCAKGEYMPPFLIHSNGGKEVVDNAYLINRAMLENLTSIPNVCVRRSQNGSMHRWLFIDYCEHFVKNLPRGYGKGGN